MASPVALFLLFGYFPEIVLGNLNVQHVSSNLKKVAWYNCTFPLEALTQEQSRSADGRGGGGKFAENHQTDWSGGDLRRRGAGPKKGNRKDWGQTELLPSSRTFNCLRSISDTVYSEPLLLLFVLPVWELF